jgi:PadR family transcriptional regulator, regulatory protein PadR
MVDANLLKGNLDLILLAVLEPTEMYGLEITKEVLERTDGYFALKEGTIYPALHRLEKAGFITGNFQYLPRGGSPVKFYTLTDTGSKELEARRKTFQRFTRAVQSLLGES